jgi:hypothetical protein
MVAMMGYGCLLLVVIFRPRNAGGVCKCQQKSVCSTKRKVFAAKTTEFFSVQALSAGGNRHISDGI